MSLPDWAKQSLKWGSAALLVAAGLLVLIIFTRMPSHDRTWDQMQAQLPQVEITGDRVNIVNVRDFSYAAADEVSDAHYGEGNYHAREITSLWYGISHFHDYGFAHTFLSFGFSDGRFLVVSIEARLEEGETYHPFDGLLRNYELIYVLGTERDIVGVRSHWRDERVLLHQLKVSQAEARDMFLDFMRDARDIESEPRFYNSLTDNCMTRLASHSEALSGLLAGWDMRVVFPGYSDEALYEQGLLDTRFSLEELRAAAEVDPSVVGIDDPAFSARIRGR